MAGLIEQAKADVLAITSNPDEFGISMTFTAPEPGNETATVVGLHTKHYIGINEEGIAVNTKNAHISVSESLLTDAGYPVRNITSGEVVLKNHKVSVKDSTGVVKNYVIEEWFPDETIGLIVCILGELE